MAACERYGISHSHYLGGPPEWTAGDRALAEAYIAYQAELCPTCGTHPDWWEPGKGGHRFAMLANARRCPGCEIREQLAEQIPTAQKGMHVFLEPNPDAHPPRRGGLIHG